MTFKSRKPNSDKDKRTIYALPPGWARKRGGKELSLHRSGKRLTQRQAILAKCYECCGYYADGGFNCEIPDCPLHPWMPFREKLRSETEPE